MADAVEGYAVVNRSNGLVINRVLASEKERNNDSQHVRLSKRREEAVLKAQRWMLTYFRDATLDVLPCDFTGRIIKKKLPSPVETQQ